jgi:hypothetical protein
MCWRKSNNGSSVFKEAVEMRELTFECVSSAGIETRTLTADQLVLAGWTGRDAALVQHHVDELKEHGVSPPSAVPMFYRCGVDLVTQTERLQVVGPDTSGEVEYVLLSFPDGLWVTVGSDQTDRKQEGAIGVAMSKQLGGKVLATTAWKLDEVRSGWDAITIKAWAMIDGARVLYQDATLGDILEPETLIAGYPGSVDGKLPVGTVMMSGTPPAIGGIRPGARFEMELSDPASARTISHAYDIDVLDVVS